MLYLAGGKMQDQGAGSGTGPQGDAKSVDAEELAMILDSAQSVVIVPGYGMAVAQAQHAVRDLTNILKRKILMYVLLFTLLLVECRDI
jgi:NAD(P) transhydrogenase subunit beta